MKIDEAIRNLEKLRSSGTTHVITAVWTLEGVLENAGVTVEEQDTLDYIEDNIDWSPINESIARLATESC